MRSALADIPPFAGRNVVNVIIDTPKGSRNKYKWDEKLGLFSLKHVEPAGMYFPFDFGFVPGTRTGDGDPMDVLMILEEPAFPGCLVPARLLGVIEAEQTKAGRTERNDRLVAVCAKAENHAHIRKLGDFGSHVLREIEEFFTNYNASRGMKFTPLRRSGAKRAREILTRAIES